MVALVTKFALATYCGLQLTIRLTGTGLNTLLMSDVGETDTAGTSDNNNNACAAYGIVPMIVYTNNTLVPDIVF